MDQDNIKDYVAKLVKRYGTDDPFSLAKVLNIIVFDIPLGELQGFYMYLKKHRTVFLNSNIEEENLRRVILAHEIGHALLHTKTNCCFMQKNTYLNTSKIEIQANCFAAELLIPDSLIMENPGMTKEQIASIAGVTKELVNFKKFT